MNKRHIVSAGLLAAVAGWSTPSAQAAGLPVIDIVQASHMVAELNDLAQAYRMLTCQYQQLQAQTAALQHTNPNVGSIAPALQAPQIQLPGSAASAMPSLLSGSTLSTTGQQFYSANGFAAPTGTDFAATEMARQMTATSNIQGEAQTGMARIAQRLASLTQLATSIQTQPDVTSVAAVNAQINAEHMYIANEGNNIANLQLMAATQQQVNQQRSQQNARMQQEQFGNTAAAQAGFGTTP